MVSKSKSSKKEDEPKPTSKTKASKSTTSKSPVRQKSPSRSTTKAKSKSPSRARSATRTKSPSRAKKASPSPVKLKPSPVKSKASPIKSKSPARQRSVERKSRDDSPREPIVTRPTARSSTRLRVKVEKVIFNDDKYKSDYKPKSYNSQSTDVPERIVHLKHFDNAKNLGEFSDEDDYTKLKEKKLSYSQYKQITEFGGWLGALFFLIATPASIIGLYIVCNEHQCSFTSLPSLKKYTLLSTWFDLMSALGCVLYVSILAILSIIPYGGKTVTGLPNKQGKLTYVMNGLSSCIILVSTILLLEARKIAITTFIVQHLFHLLIASILIGFVITTYAYIRSFYVPLTALNTNVIGKSAIYGYFMGREISPRLFNLLDLKMFVFRLGVIGPILLDIVYLYRSVTANANGIHDFRAYTFNPTLTLLVAMHLIYFFDGLIGEPTWVTSFEIQQEGFGYMGGMGYLIYPFMIAACTRYVADYDVQLATWKLVITALVFTIGYVLFRGSNNQKDAFKKNPYSASVSHLETISTSQGNKLIASGFWGIVRHPNYLGDILINLSFAPFVLCVPPVITVYSIVLLLIHRSVRDNARCKQKYGSAWDKYCNKVPYVLIPKVY